MSAQVGQLARAERPGRCAPSSWRCSRRVSQQTWRSLSSASRITMRLRARPRRAISSRTLRSSARRTVWEFALRLAELTNWVNCSSAAVPRPPVPLVRRSRNGRAARRWLEACLVAVLLDRRAVVLGELAGVAEPAGHQEMEQRPEFAEVVLQRRAGQAQAMPCRQLAGGDGGLGGGVLDVLRLVEDQQVEPLLAQLGGVAWQQGIGGQHQVVPVDAGESRRRPAPCRPASRRSGAKARPSSTEAAHENDRRLQTESR